jgi:hypothetical protein
MYCTAHNPTPPHRPAQMVLPLPVGAHTKQLSSLLYKEVNTCRQPQPQQGQKQQLRTDNTVMQNNQLWYAGNTNKAEGRRATNPVASGTGAPDCKSSTSVASNPGVQMQS